jgi:hypothetical protein
LALSCEVRRPFGSRRRDDEKQHVTLPGVDGPQRPEHLLCSRKARAHHRLRDTLLHVMPAPTLNHDQTDSTQKNKRHGSF